MLLFNTSFSLTIHTWQVWLAIWLLGGYYFSKETLADTGAETPWYVKSLIALVVTLCWPVVTAFVWVRSILRLLRKVLGRVLYFVHPTLGHGFFYVMDLLDYGLGLYTPILRVDEGFSLLGGIQDPETRASWKKEAPYRRNLIAWIIRRYRRQQQEPLQVVSSARWVFGPEGSYTELHALGADNMSLPQRHKRPLRLVHLRRGTLLVTQSRSHYRINGRAKLNDQHNGFIIPVQPLS